MSTLTILARSTLIGFNYLRIIPVTNVRGFKRWLAPTLFELEKRRKKLGPQPPPIRSSFLEWNYKAEWYAFGKRLHEEFNEGVLQCAFTHRSYVIKEEELQKEAGIENPEVKLEDNHELIKTGEEFMNHYIKCYVALLLPHFPEEGIRAVSSYLMEEKLLAYVSENLGTKDLILSADVPPMQQTFAVTLKAVVGALMESSGPERAGLFVRDFIVTQLLEKDVNELWQPADPLATLTDILNRNGRGVPEPRLINEAGRNTILATYEVAVYSDKQFIGSGSGETVQVATHLAAHDALKRMFRTTEDMLPFSFNLDPFAENVSQSKHNVSISNWKSSGVVSC